MKLPAELASNIQVSIYVSASPGWNRCPLGYSFFVDGSDKDSKIIVPGIVLDGDPFPKRKFYFPPFKVSKQTIEKFADELKIQRQQVKAQIEETKRATEAELNILVHDLRALSSAIYHSALEAKTELDKTRYADCEKRIDTVLATQTLLSVRIDSLDFASNPSLLAPKEIPIYRRVDKIVRCFHAQANNKKIDLLLLGEFFGAAKGPDVFELIPFALVENAIKYSPVGQTVSVKIHETSTNRM